MKAATAYLQRFLRGEAEVEIKTIDLDFTVCKVKSVHDTDLESEFCFIGRTDEEISLVCPTENVPAETAAREDGWRGFRICGTLDFSLIGVLSGITGILAEKRIGVFAVSTYNTDYIFVKKENFGNAIKALKDAGYGIV